MDVWKESLLHANWIGERCLSVMGEEVFRKARGSLMRSFSECGELISRRDHLEHKQNSSLFEL